METGEILLRRGLIDRRQLDLMRGGDGVSMLETAVEKGFVQEEDALKAIGEEVGLDFVDLPNVDVDLALLKSFPVKLIYRQSLFPVRRQNGSLIVATSDPFDLYPLD